MWKAFAFARVAARFGAVALAFALSGALLLSSPPHASFAQDIQLAQSSATLKTPPPPRGKPDPRGQPGARSTPPEVVAPEPRLPDPGVTPEALLQGLPGPGDESPLPGEAPGALAGGSTVPGQVLVVLASATPGEIAADYGLSGAQPFTLASLGATAFVANLPPGQDELAFIDLMALDPRVRLAQFNYVYQAQGIAASSPSNRRAATKHSVSHPHPPTASQWVPPSPLRGRGITAQQVQAKPVLVGIVDTGIDRAHPALQGRAIELVDVVGDGDEASLKGAHGTALAGIIVGGDQLSGAAPAARILGLRAFTVAADEPGAGRSSSQRVAQAIDLAIQRGVQVLNLSFAGSRDPVVALLLQIAEARGMLIVAAAGNNGPDAPPAYPGALEEVLAATAIDGGGRLLPQANRGDYVALAAPGVGLLVAQPDGRYGLKDGTSLAAAQVSGLAAALLAETPDLKGEQLRRLMEETAVDLGAPGRDPDFGAGRIDPPAARAAAKALVQLDGG